MIKLRHQGGFTLVETLVSLLVFALISAGSMAALNSAVQGRQRLGENTSKLADLDMARALIRSDMGELVLRPARDPYGNAEPFLLKSTSDELLVFTRQGRSNPGGLQPRGDLQRIRYQFEGGELIRQVMAHENPAPEAEFFEMVLIKDLKDVQIDWFAGNDFAQYLTIQRSGTISIPKIMRLELTYNNGDAIQQLFEVGL